MRQRFLDYYERELEHLYGAARAVGAKHPTNAARLGLDRATPLDSDPFVKQLVEGVAFLTARLEARLDDTRVEHARHLLEIVRPGLLAPLPSCLIARFEPRLSSFTPQPRLRPVRVERAQVLRTRAHGDVPECRFTTTAAVELWPLVCTGPRHEAVRERLETLGRAVVGSATEIVAIDLETCGAIPLDTLALDALPLYLDGGPGGAEPVQRLLQSLHLGTRAVRVVADGRDVTRGAPRLEPVGFEPDEALLPDPTHGFDGDRLVREFFAFRAKFEFVRVAGLAESFANCPGQRCTLLFLTETGDSGTLAGDVRRVAFRPFCTPAINLFERTLLPLPIESNRHEHLLLVDRVAAARYEIHSVLEVHGRTPRGRTRFSPYFSDLSSHDEGGSFYALERRSSALLERSEGIDEDRYAGSELWLSLLDAGGHQFTSDPRLVLDVKALCSNRHLPLLLDVARTDLELLEGSGYVESVTVAGAPSAPRAASAGSAGIWALVGLLTRHYRMLDGEAGESAERAAGLRATLALLSGLEGTRDAGRRQIDETERQGLALLRGGRDGHGGLVGLECRPGVHAVSRGGTSLPVRGLDVRVSLDVDVFPGRAVWLFSIVLSRFLARHAALNTSVAVSVVDAGGHEVLRC